MTHTYGVSFPPLVSLPESSSSEMQSSSSTSLSDPDLVLSADAALASTSRTHDTAAASEGFSSCGAFDYWSGLTPHSISTSMILPRGTLLRALLFYRLTTGFVHYVFIFLLGGYIAPARHIRAWMRRRL